MRPLPALLALALALPACAAAPAEPDGALVLVSAPLSSSPWVGRSIAQGAQLAADGTGEAGPRVRLEVLDNAGSPQRVLAHARRAVSSGAVALVLDGVGAEAVAEVTDPVGLPVLVVREGGEGIVDPQADPTLFRLAPADGPMTRRLADYTSEQADRVALLADDSGYGREGLASLETAFARNEVDVVARQVVPEGGNVSAAVLAARRAQAQALVVWARPDTVAAVLRAARGTGWQVPVLSGPTAEDPLVRQRLADRPEWVDGLRFVSFRITSEVGPEPFAAYRAAYEERFGVERVGVGDVVQPPDWATYASDAVRLVEAALATGQPLLQALESTVITGANGDERGFGPTDREGVSPDDMYFARFSGMRFAPVDDDVLSEGLPAVEQ